MDRQRVGIEPPAEARVVEALPEVSLSLNPAIRWICFPNWIVWQALERGSVSARLEFGICGAREGIRELERGILRMKRDFRGGRGGVEGSEGEFSVHYACKWARSAIPERAQALVFMSLNLAIRWICSMSLNPAIRWICCSF